MNDSNSDLDRLRELVHAQSRGIEDAEMAPLLRLARALTAETPPPEACARCRAEMPAMAQAELAGERLVRLFPISYAHLDICEECSLQYAELLDMLTEMEAAVGQAAAVAPPILPPRLTIALRIRNWVSATLRQMLDRFQVSADDVEGMLSTLMERLPQLPAAPAPLATGQMALAFDGEDEETPLLLATWFAAEKLADTYTTDELQALASARQLANRAREVAEATARQLEMPGRARRSFVEQFVKSVEADRAGVVAMGRDGSAPPGEGGGTGTSTSTSTTK